MQLGGGDILDLLPDEDGIVLMARVYIPEHEAGSINHIGSAQRGLGVDRIDTRTLQKTTVEPPADNVISYISDGRGNVRIMGVQVYRSSTRQITGVIKYLYRTGSSREWHALGEYDGVNRTGFYPVAVDPQMNAALGYEKKDGRLALYKIALDGSMREEVVYGGLNVDLDGLMYIGRRDRVVGVRYATDRSHAFYFDPAIKAIHASLERTLPNQPILLSITDSSVDESKLLVFAGSDNDSGTYYLFDRTAKQMRPLLAVREALDGVKLASVKPVQYPASDGTMIPAYLTLPPGRETTQPAASSCPTAAHRLAISGASTGLRSSLHPAGLPFCSRTTEARPAMGMLELEKNGFRSWPVAIGDVLDGGRWLVAQGIADAGKVAIVGWSYGGYAALQSAVVDPSVFKAVVAIAPVTDLNALKEEHRNWSDFNVVSEIVGDGPHLREGSPLQNAARVKVPVLLFAAALDRNIGCRESERMAAALTAAHDRCELVTFADLDHQLDDSEVRLADAEKERRVFARDDGPLILPSVRDFTAGGLNFYGR